MENPSSASKPVVLLVDDSHALLVTTSALLAEDYEVLTAQDGREALEVLRRTEVDIVCADYSMPGMTGVELLRQVAELPNPPVGVLITGHLQVARDQRDDYHVLYKPYGVDKLLEFVGSAARVAKMRKAVRKFANKPLPSARSGTFPAIKKPTE